MVAVIQAKDNALLKRVRSLNKRKYREREGKFILEGPVVIAEALAWHQRPELLIVSASFYQREEGKGFCRQAQAQAIAVYQVADHLFAGLTPTQEPQGILAVMEKPTANWQELAQANQPFWLIVDGLQDPGNLGTIIRTAAAVKADGLVLTKDTVDLYNDKTLRSTMGALFKVKILQGINSEEVVGECRRLGLSLVLADPRATLSCYQWDFTQRMALVIGNEHRGPGSVLVNNADVKIHIPMPGAIESLNVGVAAGILMFERVRQTAQGILR